MKKVFYLILSLLFFSTNALAFNFQVGFYSGNVTDNRNITVSPSFIIDALFIKCNAAQYLVASTSSMPADTTNSLSNGATVTNRIQSMGTGTFQIGSNAEVNTTGTDNCFYAAFGSDSNSDMAVGTYTGNATDNRDIVISPAFQPGFVTMLFNGATASNSFRVAAETGDASLSWYSQSGENANRIQAFNVDGFEIGTLNSVNENAIPYYPIAVKDIPNYVASGTYTAGGSATDDLAITVGFQPDFVLIKSTEINHAAIFRTSAMSGDFSCPANQVACGTNFIQSFTATGFTIGTSVSVQNPTTTYYWWAIKTPVYSASTRRPITPIAFP